jgi:zinc transport system substrate-binding protein
MELTDLMKKNSVKIIYYEELIDPKLARILSGETGASLVLLNAAHNIEKNDILQNTDFIAIMESDLAALKQGLQ